MKKINKDILIVSICALFFQTVFGQSGSAKLCIDAEPLCALSQISYPNTSGRNFAENGPDYGCMIGQINPSWFYFQIEQGGDIKLQIEQSETIGGTPNLDVDFIAYGPFVDANSPCILDLTASNIVDCGYHTDFIEHVEILNTQPGEYYLLLITNFSKESGFISVTQTAGTATTNCNLLKAPIVANEVDCSGNSHNLDASTNNATHYIWYEDDGTTTDTFNAISGVNISTYSVTVSNTYRAVAFDVNNVLLETFEFNTTFFQTPNIPLNIEYTICDNFGASDGIAEFDLNTKNNEVLNGLNPSNFSVTYHDNIINANSGINPLPLIYINSLQAELIYVRVENIQTTDASCFEVASVSITVNMLPEPNLDDTYILCVNTNGTEEIQIPPRIDTDLSIADYSFTWSLNGSVLTSETNRVLNPSDEGEYEVIATNLTTGCSNTATTMVNLSAPPEVTTELISYAFIDENNIEVTATGIGERDYLFSIDGEPWQTDNIFKNVSIGKHIITVKNLTGCGQTNISIIVMDYPLYFTPNGDGYNDTWNIVGLKNQLQAKVYIFDRFGKLLKQVNPNSIGWDGAFNGTIMPNNDYWFTVEYIEPKNGKLSVFKAHFTLKR